MQRTWEYTSLSPVSPSSPKTLTLQINDVPVAVTWEDNASVDALKELVQENPLTVSMSRYGGFEQVGSAMTYYEDTGTMEFDVFELAL